MLIDNGHSRALLIPESHNLSGFPEGISGRDYLSLLREHARFYGAALIQGRIEDLQKTPEGFAAHSTNTSFAARSVLLATGVTNKRPDIDDDTHAKALGRGHLRYCPVCDGYEVSGQNVAVIGTGDRAVCEAEFLRSYTERVTIISNTADDFDDDLRRRLGRINAAIRLGPITAINLRENGLEVATADESEIYDAVYPALGSSIHSRLAKILGASASDDGCIKVDRHQRTAVKQLYAAGDVVYGLDQISVCNGQAAIAAVTLRNDLGEERPLLWPLSSGARSRGS
ncbi:NAD(P)/FAD-dependent oxidoreductase [Bosea vestrisii]|uniref:NAD(P)/FAD-dependent oxidoreductase n=1 Tax=Bosea vestrisii TaxID=151416 RepID=UPI0024DF4F8E|nr:NAD(P)/FAD-dependent oxidoreductase [Bosea vestrisii]WID99286.1 NAD(P)/FAD-dependent oxidoreductase [Bosea vestrisii]